MPKFLVTTGVSHHLQEMIDNSQERIILISPYLQLNDRIKESLEDKDKLKLDIRIVYGKSELSPDETDWLRELRFIRTSFCKNLHAKCYLNEKEAILTSMNLYEFSQVNNIEMGILISRDEDTELFEKVYTEAQRIIRISDEVQISVSKVKEEYASPNDSVSSKKGKAKKSTDDNGYCIVCSKSIPLDPKHPYCKECYSTWKLHKNPENREEYCHICGAEFSSSLVKPACYHCYKKHRNKLDFPAT